MIAQFFKKFLLCNRSKRYNFHVYYFINKDSRYKILTFIADKYLEGKKFLIDLDIFVLILIAFSDANRKLQDTNDHMMEMVDVQR